MEPSLFLQSYQHPPPLRQGLGKGSRMVVVLSCAEKKGVPQGGTGAFTVLAVYQAFSSSEAGNEEIQGDDERQDGHCAPVCRRGRKIRRSSWWG